MRFDILCIAILTFYVTKASAAASAAYFVDPAHPGKCVIKQPDLIMSPGERYDFPNSCAVIKCGEKGLVERYSCGIIAVPKGCRLRETLDAAAVYPDCCPDGIICNDIPNDE